MEYPSNCVPGEALHRQDSSPSPSGERSRKIALLALFSAVPIATNYLLLPLPNIKLMDAFVFAAAFTLGWTYGAFSAAMVWLVYGTLNPLGSNPYTLAMVIGGEMLYVAGGALLAHGSTRALARTSSLTQRSLAFGATGLLLTLGYDVFTNAATGILVYGSAVTGLLTMNFPLPLGIIHEASNFAFFSLFVPLLVSLTVSFGLSVRTPAGQQAMEMNKGKKGRGIWFPLALALLVTTVIGVGSAIYFYQSSAVYESLYHGLVKKVEGTLYGVNYLINDGQSRVWHNDTLVPVGWTLLNLTLKMADGDVNYTFGEYGAIVNAIKGVGLNKDEAHQSYFWLWWRFDPFKQGWVMGESSLDSYRLRDGDIVACSYSDTSKYPDIPPP